jgi:hypothetical protein
MYVVKKKQKENKKKQTKKKQTKKNKKKKIKNIMLTSRDFLRVEYYMLFSFQTGYIM